MTPTTLDVLRRDAITSWAWSDAPEHFRAMSTHGGDEDWVMFVPSGCAPWLWHFDPMFSRKCGVSVHDPVTGEELGEWDEVGPNGRDWLLIGTHA